MPLRVLTGRLNYAWLLTGASFQKIIRQEMELDDPADSLKHDDCWQQAMTSQSIISCN
jgi:hypothetical protein